MAKRLIKAMIISVIVCVLPVLGNLQILLTPQMALLYVIAVIASVLQPDYHIMRDKTNSKDKGTEVQIIWSVIITQTAALIEAAYFRYPESIHWDMVTTVSLAFILLGLAIRTWAVYTLGKFFTMQIDLQSEHQVIRSGPYRFVRHPSYAGAFFLYIGTIVFMHSWASLVLALIVLPLAWMRRIEVEEKMLLNGLGEAYLEYSRSVKRIIPGVW